MISIDELRIRQAEFESIRQDFNKELKKLESDRKQLIKIYNLGKIANMTIENFVVGHHNNDAFCYWLETRLMSLGKIKGGAPADKKFGIYHGKTKSDKTIKYRWVKKFGKSKDEAFQNIKNAILSLLDAGKGENINSIRKNPLSPMFKGKILATYYPEKYLNIFAKDHLEYFLDKIGIYYDENHDEIDKRQLLVDFKNKDDVMSSWSLYEYSKFLYESFGRPVKKEDAPDALKPYIESSQEYPKMKDVKAEFIDLSINKENPVAKPSKIKTSGKTVDFEKENRLNTTLGKRGEKIVFNLESNHLKGIGKYELAEKIRQVSEEDDSLGYDILSFTDNGEEKYIEVKATASPYESSVKFLLSDNQYKKSKELKNYYIYVVFSAKSKSPKVWKIKNPMVHENKGMVLIPIKYRAVINTSVKK